MEKNGYIYECTHCQNQTAKWSGRCLECGKWGTLEKVASLSAALANQAAHITHAQKRTAALAGVKAKAPTAFTQISAAPVQRLVTHITEFDRVLGGGIVPGSLILLGGDPGIGKSTLVAQAAVGVGQKVLYVSGEESGEQIKMRLDRLPLKQNNLLFLAEEHVETICQTIVQHRPALAIVDSIQTVASSSVGAEPGSVNQIKVSTVRFLEIAKSSGIPILLIGHVTKGGELGGPKTLEHLVDAVVYLEGDAQHQFRILRSVKNRFGSTNEIGVFTMAAAGLVEVSNPSQVFLRERSLSAGSCITASVEGSRILLLEVQALVTRTPFGFPQRKCSGFDLNRLNLLLAVLASRAGLQLGDYDVHVNIAGGMRVNEPAVDLAVVLAIVSAVRGKVIDKNVVAFGEVGLGGEVRSITRQKERSKEAQHFGFKNIIAPPAVKNLLQAIELTGLSVRG